MWFFSLGPLSWIIPGGMLLIVCHILLAPLPHAHAQIISHVKGWLHSFLLETKGIERMVNHCGLNDWASLMCFTLVNWKVLQRLSYITLVVHGLLRFWHFSLLKQRIQSIWPLIWWSMGLVLVMVRVHSRSKAGHHHDLVAIYLLSDSMWWSLWFWLQMLVLMLPIVFESLIIIIWLPNIWTLE